MTLIAYAIAKDNPVIIGDILITSSENIEGYDQELPIFFNTLQRIEPTITGIHPFDLKQKIYVIKERIAFGFAGSVFEATNFLRDIKLFFANKDATLENLQSFLYPYDINKIRNVSGFFLIAVKPNHPFKSIPFGTYKKTNNFWFSSCLAVGSGANSFVNLIKETDKQKGIFPNNYYEVSKSMLLSIVAKLKALEKFSLNNIKEGWGAGFELISFDGKKFYKPNCITYIIWLTEIDANYNYNNRAVFAINYKYYDELLVITSCDLSNKIQKYFVTTLDKTIYNINIDAVPELSEFNSGDIACCWIRSKNDKHEVFKSMFIPQSHESRNKINVTQNSNESFEASIEESFEKELFSEIKDMIIP